MLILLLVFHILSFGLHVQGLCGDSIKWSHRVNINDIYGVWYGVGYAQHNPDMTNIPNKAGCITLYITDATDEYRNNWLSWSNLRRNYSDQSWRSSRSNPWSQNAISGSWLDIRIKRKVKRNINEDQKRIRVLWDEDGHTVEQIYLYYSEEPGLWTVERLRPMEQELMFRGIDVWYPDDPPRHPDVIRLLKVTQNTLVLNHCSEIGNGGIFSLILRRSPVKVERWEWHQYQREFSKFDLPNAYRHSAICSACNEKLSFICYLFEFCIIFLFHMYYTCFT